MEVIFFPDKSKNPTHKTRRRINNCLASKYYQFAEDLPWGSHLINETLNNFFERTHVHNENFAIIIFYFEQTFPNLESINVIN